MPTFQTFIPDYTIKAVTDVLYLKIKRTTYLRALKASIMGKKTTHSGELNERELENLLEKVMMLLHKSLTNGLFLVAGRQYCNLAESID